MTTLFFLFMYLQDYNLAEVQKFFETYLNNRHAIPNKKIILDVYLDDRIPNSGYGIVYYKLIAK